MRGTEKKQATMLTVLCPERVVPEKRAGSGCNRGVPQLRCATRNLGFSGPRVAVRRVRKAPYSLEPSRDSGQTLVDAIPRNPRLNAAKRTSSVRSRDRAGTELGHFVRGC